MERMWHYHMDLDLTIHEAAQFKHEAKISEIYESRAFKRYMDCPDRLTSWRKPECSKSPIHYLPISTNQLAVLFTECWQPIRFRLSVVYASLGISNKMEDNSNVIMRYYYDLLPLVRICRVRGSAGVSGWFCANSNISFIKANPSSANTVLSACNQHSNSKVDHCMFN